MPPTIAASVVARAVDAAIADGLTPRAVEALLGRPRAALTADARVPIDAMFALFAAALRHSRDPAFPLRVAQAMAIIYEYQFAGDLDQIVLWCDLNDEQAALEQALTAVGAIDSQL